MTKILAERLLKSVSYWLLRNNKMENIYAPYFNERLYASSTVSIETRITNEDANKSSLYVSAFSTWANRILFVVHIQLWNIFVATSVYNISWTSSTYAKCTTTIESVTLCFNCIQYEYYQYFVKTTRFLQIFKIFGD